jgi:hypothetical protein
MTFHKPSHGKQRERLRESLRVYANPTVNGAILADGFSQLTDRELFLALVSPVTEREEYLSLLERQTSEALETAGCFLGGRHSD